MDDEQEEIRWMERQKHYSSGTKIAAFLFMSAMFVIGIILGIFLCALIHMFCMAEEISAVMQQRPQIIQGCMIPSM